MKETVVILPFCTECTNAVGARRAPRLRVDDLCVKCGRVTHNRAAFKIEPVDVAVIADVVEDKIRNGENDEEG